MVDTDVTTLTANDSVSARDPAPLIAGRFAIAVAIGGGVAIAGWFLAPRMLKGHFDVVGYPLYADFDVNRYFDAFYLIAIVFPVVALATYFVVSRFGPLRRTVARRRVAAQREPGTADDVEATTVLGRFGRLILVGGIGGLVLASGSLAHPTSTVLIAAIVWTVLVGGVAATIARRNRAVGERVAGVANALGVVAYIPLLAHAAAHAGVTITSTHTTVHYPLFPIQVALVTTAVALGGLGIALWRRPSRAPDIDRPLLRYLALPIAILLTLSYIPGALGPMDTFGEGEYLAAGTRILNGALPWRDIWLIHGLLDDGLKSLVGFALFGYSRWGATAGITALITPAYFVAYYLFSAYLLRRRWALTGAAAVAFGCSVFVDWDVRYFLLPIVLIALLSTLRHPTAVRGAFLGFMVVAQSVLVPELGLALPPFVIVIALADLYRARGSWRAWTAWRSTVATVGGVIVTGGVFGIYLLATHSLRGFVDYYRNFGDAHSLTGGIPLYTNYGRYGHADRYGVLHFFTTPTGVTTRYAIELVLPLVAILVTVWLTTAIVRGGRRLSPEDFCAIAMAGLVLLYFQKSISRGDTDHIGEVFAVSTPLIVMLVARLAGSLDLAAAALAGRITRGATEKWGAKLRTLVERRGLASLAVFVVVAVQAPVGLSTIVDNVPGRLLATVASPAAKPYVAGAPSLGFADPDALPTGLVANLERIFATEAGPHGAVFDFSDAPGIVDFLLDRNPASRFYDISLAITPSAQRLVIADLEASRPNVVLFSGLSGLSTWDFIANDVRQYLVANYILDHYHPLVYIAGELVLISDTITPKPLPRLIGRPARSGLDFTLAKCDLGYIPNFLDSPAPPPSALTLPLIPVASHGKGRLYRIELPANRHTYEWLSLSRSGDAPAAITLTNIIRSSGADVPWHDITWVALDAGTTTASVGSCLQWHGFGPTLYLRYVGPGTPTEVHLFNS